MDLNAVAVGTGMVALVTIGGFLGAQFVLPSFRIGAPFIRTKGQRLGQLSNILKNHTKVRGTFLDLGCGDGEVLSLANRQGFQHIIGYEINPSLYVYSKWRLRSMKNVQLRRANYMYVDDPFAHKSSIIYIFGIPEIMDEFKQRLLIDMADDSLLICSYYGLPYTEPHKIFHHPEEPFWLYRKQDLHRVPGRLYNSVFKNKSYDEYYRDMRKGIVA